jgi:hypothetical protein
VTSDACSSSNATSASLVPAFFGSAAIARVHAVGGDEALAVGVGDRDHRIEEPADLGDHGGEPLGVGLGQLALVRRRLDLVERQRGERDPEPAERFAVGRDHRSAGRLDPRAQPRDLARRCVGHDLGRREADRAGLRCLLALALRGRLGFPGCGRLGTRRHGFTVVPLTP